MDHARALAECGNADFAALAVACRNSSRANAVFSTVSVVRMACAASMKAVRLRAQMPSPVPAKPRSAFPRAAARRSCPSMTETLPPRGSRRRLRRGSAGGRAASRPACPAAQLALPALMATTRTLPPVARKCSLSTIKRRGNHAVGGERGCGAGRHIGHNQREIGASAGLQAGLGSAKTESPRNDKMD